MSSSGSVSRWICEIRRGSDQAAEALWNHYQRRLRGVAKRWLKRVRSRVVDEDDVALSAFHSFLRRSQRGGFPLVENRDAAWRLLVVIVVRKALNQARDEGRQRRNPRQYVDDAFEAYTIAQEAVDPAPTPAVAAMVADSLAHLLSLLDNQEMREIAMAKLAGYTNQDIAQTLEKSVATVERRLKLIRVRWQQEIEP